MDKAFVDQMQFFLNTDVPLDEEALASLDLACSIVRSRGVCVSGLEEHVCTSATTFPSLNRVPFVWRFLSVRFASNCFLTLCGW